MIARIVKNRIELTRPGDIMEVSHKEGVKKIILCCPGCGKELGLNHEYDHLTITVKPSIICESGCNWHGHLTNGEFIYC